jgi:ribosomal protein S18 acetylase RimI-like enzyme
MPVIREVRTGGDIEQARRLFVEYQAALGVDLCFQGFAEELATLPGNYSRPGGRLLLAVDGATILGGIALRALHGADCEMKRLYVRPEGRGQGVGRMLAAAVIGEARQAGYHRILLDTLPAMKEAQALYRSLGFKEIAPYYPNPIEGTSYMALSLQAGRDNA